MYAVLAIAVAASYIAVIALINYYIAWWLALIAVFVTVIAMFHGVLEDSRYGGKAD